MADGFEAQVADVLAALGFEDNPDDPEAGFIVAVELGLSDGEVLAMDQASGEVLLRTDRSQILRNIEIAAARGELSITELVENGVIRRAALRDD